MILPRFIFCLLITSLLSSCSSNSSSDKTDEKGLVNEIENALKAKYEEPFSVTDHYFETGLNLYVFTAHPEKKPQLLFEGSYDERKQKKADRIINDAYVNMNYSFEANEYFVSLFPENSPQYVTACSVYSNQKDVAGKVPDWNDYLKFRNEGSTVRMNAYFFEIPTSKEHKSVQLIHELVQGLQAKYENNFSLYIGFWPEGFLEDKDLEKLTFGFESTSQNDADHLLNKTQYLAKEFFVKVVNGSVAELTDEQIFQLIKPYNKNGPTEMVEI